MAHTLFHDVGVETLYTDYSIGYTVRPKHILFRPYGLTLNKRNDRQRSPIAIMQTNSSLCMRRVRINVMGVVLSINDRRNRISGRGLCEPFTKKISQYDDKCSEDSGTFNKKRRGVRSNKIQSSSSVSSARMSGTGNYWDPDVVDWDSP